MPDVYRYEFACARTGNSYRLDISPAGATPLGGSPTIEMLDGDAIREISDVMWSHDKNVPYGMPSSLTAKVVFRPTLCPSDLLSWLVDGITEITSTFYSGGDDHQVTFETGTIFTLSVKPVGSTYWTVGGRFVQDVTQQAEIDHEANQLTVNIGDALQLACKALTFMESEFGAGLVQADYDAATHVPGTLGLNAKTAVVDWVWRASGKWFYVAHVPPSSEPDNDPASCYWSARVQSICDLWSSYVEKVLQSILRQSVNSNIKVAIMDALANMTKQSYGTNALPSSTLTSSELRWLMFATNNNDFSPSTTLDYSIHDTLGRAYDNLWDFLYDMPRSRFKVWAITHYYDGAIDSGIRSYRPFEYPQTTQDATNEFRSAAKFTLRKDIVARVEVSTEFALGSDYDHTISKAPTSRNNESFDVPTIFDSAPVADSYNIGRKSTGFAAFTDISQEVRDRLQNTEDVEEGTVDLQGRDETAIGNPRFLGLYYLENPNIGGNAFFFDGGLIRCHAWQPFVVAGETITPPSSSETVLSSTPGTVGGEGIALVEGAQNGVVAQLAPKIFDSYYGRNTTTIETTVSTNFGAVISPTGTSLLLPFVPVIRAFEVDASAFVPYLTALPTTYHVVAVKANLNTGLMEITLWGRV